jgi:hypothetical protein
MSRHVISDEPVSLDRLVEMLEQAAAEVSALCHGKRWRMCVPVDSDDSDIVIGDALRHARAFIAAHREREVAAPLPASAALQALIADWRGRPEFLDSDDCADQLEAALRGIAIPRQAE